MINLLPPDQKRQLRAARSNTLLIRYNFLLLGALGFLVLASGFVWFFLNNAKATAEQTLADNNAKVTGFAAIKNESDTFRSNLATAKQILDKEVTYTKVILEIASLMPKGVVLDSLDLDSQTFGTPIVLSARAKSYESALALKNSFEKSALFTDVHFQSITTNDDTSGYNYTVSLSVTIQKGAAK